MISYILIYQSMRSYEARIDIDILHDDEEELVDKLINVQSEDWYLSTADINYRKRNSDSIDLHQFVTVGRYTIEKLILDILELRCALLTYDTPEGFLKLAYFEEFFLGYAAVSSIKRYLSLIQFYIEDTNMKAYLLDNNKEETIGRKMFDIVNYNFDDFPAMAACYNTDALHHDILNSDSVGHEAWEYMDMKGLGALVKSNEFVAVGPQRKTVNFFSTSTGSFVNNKPVKIYGLITRNI